MTRQLSAFLVFVLITVTSFAQNKPIETDHENFFRCGVKAGININKIKGVSYKDGYRYNFQAGMFLQFNLSSRLGLQPEVNFVQSSSEISNSSNDVYDDLFGDGNQHKATLSYLEVPVLLNLNLGQSKRIKLQAGPAYGILLKQSADSASMYGPLYKNSEWSMIGGLWIQLPLVNMGARYKLGLTSINNTNNDQSWKNQAVQVFIGLTF